jgi:hypothetical protein
MDSCGRLLWPFSQQPPNSDRKFCSLHSSTVEPSSVYSTLLAADAIESIYEVPGCAPRRCVFRPPVSPGLAHHEYKTKALAEVSLYRPSKSVRIELGDPLFRPLNLAKSDIPGLSLDAGNYQTYRAVMEGMRHRLRSCHLGRRIVSFARLDTHRQGKTRPAPGTTAYRYSWTARDRK